MSSSLYVCVPILLHVAHSFGIAFIKTGVSEVFVMWEGQFGGGVEGPPPENFEEVDSISCILVHFTCFWIAYFYIKREAIT